MATTDTGWPYHEPADTLYTWPATSQSLAELLDARLGAGGLVLLASSAPSAASSVIFNTVFDAAVFGSYLVEYNLDLSASSGHLLARMRLSGTDNSSANYAWQYVQGVGGSAGAGQTLASTSMGVGLVTSTGSWGTVELWRPDAAASTRVLGHSGGADTSPVVNSYAAAHNVATAYDGITLYASTGGTLTGNVRLYGRVK